MKGPSRGERAGERIVREASSWPGVEARPHRFGGTEFRIGRREIGHVHGDHLLDIPLPHRLRDEVVAEGRAEAHHVLPESGWVSVRLRSPQDVDRGLELLRLSYELAMKQKAQRGSPES